MSADGASFKFRLWMILEKEKYYCWNMYIFLYLPISIPILTQCTQFLLREERWGWLTHMCSWHITLMLLKSFGLVRYIYAFHSHSNQGEKDTRTLAMAMSGRSYPGYRLWFWIYTPSAYKSGYHNGDIIFIFNWLSV